MSRLRKLQLLSGQQRWWLVQAIFLLPINAVAFGLLGLKDWQRVLVWLASAFRTSHGNAGLAQANRVAGMVELAARCGFLKANCLQRSLTLWWMLKRLGLHGELKIGVRLNQQQCEAHAWVEYLGCVLNDSTDVSERFAPFAGAIFTAETEI
ncbi:MAG: lasso peptide biosynthesis B2 protein [Blastocatellia bacterium]